MDSKSFTEGLEDEMSCSVCQELFKDPVTLRCGHNFCRECLCEYWKEKISQLCPICRADSAITDLKTNYTLRNIVEMHKKERKKSKIQSKYVCSQHGEKRKLYCLEDEKAICLVCQTSRKHKNHKFLPIEEAAQEFKEELKNSLKPLQDTHQKIAELKEKYRGNLNNIHDQAGKTEKQIKEDFVKLHKFLHKEEKNLLADLKKEKEEKEQKMRAMEESIVQDLTSVSKIIKDIQQKMNEEDYMFPMSLRDMRERIKKYADYKPREPEAVSAADIDGYKYKDRLQYRVWKKMLKFINRVTVTLDPNTAHPQLILSEDLTAVTYGHTRREDLPDNPERFDHSYCVLGSEGFTSGTHSWVVDVEKQTFCFLGVAAESANRKGDFDLTPELGYWIVQLYYGDYCAYTDEEGLTQLDVLKSPKKVLVCVDYEAGEVSFSNADDMSHMYTFTHKFKHKIFPFFFTGTDWAPLRICNL
ncbi:E3 ubiquitin-protein ligase TRIM39-like [Latimeria chalumnae]|uniref:E3 ubiquitin-protein ligase TRIM39-like n=1 Tax=Latimeria chalumnae TaxID=7897 RepID=UPI00313D6763